LKNTQTAAAFREILVSEIGNRRIRMKQLSLGAWSVGILLVTVHSLPAASIYAQTNLASDVPGLAAFTDPNLVNPWGMANSATSPFWLSNQGAGNSTLYIGNGMPQSLVVTVPPTGIPSGPTGIVFNSSPTGFVLGDGSSASFIFDTLAGTIDAWNGGEGTTAAIQNTAPGAVYTGLAQSGSTLYAANFAGETIDVYNSSFAPTTVPGNFVNRTLPSGYSPYNIALINGDLYVEYDAINPSNGMPMRGVGLGIVAEFDTNGNYIQTFVNGGAGSLLDAPWGITMAPATGFGSFSGDILIGNFGNGEINAYNPTTGAYQGTISDSSGNPIVNANLWAIEFRTGGTDVNPDALYFDAGIDNQTEGLFGDVTVVPEPGSLGLVLAGFAFIGLWAVSRKFVKPADGRRS
jgi:uncharacterized protein (TIGR03118 family)